MRLLNSPGYHGLNQWGAHILYTYLPGPAKEMILEFSCTVCLCQPLSFDLLVIDLDWILLVIWPMLLSYNLADVSVLFIILSSLYQEVALAVLK